MMRNVRRALCLSVAAVLVAGLAVSGMGDSHSRPTVSVPASEPSVVAHGKHITVAQQERPPFTTCMAEAGMPTVPLPGALERRSWSVPRQQAYKAAFWSCARSVFDLN
jgi:hypothetical protein